MIHFRKIILAFLSTFFLPNTVFAEESQYAIEKIGMEKGLCNNYIQSITEDSSGFLWVATEWGLNRFDGNSFKVFKNEADDLNSISGNGINKVLADNRNNKIWIATKRDGLNAYCYDTQKFVRYPIVSEEKNSTHAFGITDLAFDAKGDVWIATYGNGLKKLIVAEDSIVHCGNIINDHYIWTIADDYNDNLYIGHVDAGLSVFSFKEQTLKQFTHIPGNDRSLPGNTVFRVYIDSRKNVWVGTNNGLALYHPESDEFTVFRNIAGNPDSLLDNDIHSIRETDGNMLWIGTSKGINILNLQHIVSLSSNRIKFGHIRANDLSTGLSDGNVNDIFQDSYGNIWIGTNRALNFISHSKPFFNTIGYTSIKGDNNALSAKTASCLYYDNRTGNLWVGTEGGGIDVYKEGKKTAHYHPDNSTLAESMLESVIVDSSGQIWFGTRTKGLIRMNGKTGQFEECKLPYTVSTNEKIPVTSLFEDSHGNLWIGTYNGVFRFNLRTEEVIRIEGQDILLPSNLIRGIAQDSNGNIWIGSLINGVSVINPELKLIKKIDHFINGINHIYRDSNGSMWVSTFQGIYYFPYDTSYSEFTGLNHNNGIADDYIHAATEGNEGEMWFSTNIGISYYSKATNTFENFAHSNGVPLGSFISGSVTKSNDGTIFFGSQNGICYFDSKKLAAAQEIPPVKVTDFSLYGTDKIQSGHFISIPVSPVIELKHNQNTFVIEFNTMDYSLKNLMEYSYSLSGLDNVWYTSNGHNQVIFKNLSPGKYIFNVKARMKNRNWTDDNAATIEIRISPPFWLSWWAKTIYILFIAGIGTVIIRSYYKKRDRIKQQELSNEKLKFYTNIAHELKTPLTLVLGPLTDLMKSTELTPEQFQKISYIHKSANRMHTLINQIMEFRKSETHNRKLRVLKSDLATHIKEIVMKYIEQNQNKDLVFEVFIETKVTKLYFDPEILTIILDNLISNAIKYTAEGSISVFMRDLFKNGKRYTEIEVRDTGYGMPEDALDKIFNRYFQVKGDHQVVGSGIGLALVKNMAQLHEASVDVKSKLRMGTSFFIRLETENTYPRAEHIPEEDSTADDKTNAAALPLLLLAEDHREIRKYIAESLSQSFEVLEAENGRVAAELAFERIPDIVVADIMMPVMDGITLCKIVKEDMRTSHIPVIFLTAKDSVYDKIEGYSIGADSYITKPFNASLLETRINNLLESRRKMENFFTTTTYKNIISTNALNDLDNQFIEKVTSLIEENISSEQISAYFLAEQLCMSYSTFSRKIKAITGMTSKELIRKIKMKRAEKMLLSRKYTITEIAYELGFSNMSHFRQYFKEEFGVTPSGYLKDISGGTSA